MRQNYNSCFYHVLLILSLGFAACQKEKITFSANASDTFYLDNEKCSMRILVEGNTLSKTFLIFLHGGPGVSSYFYSTSTIRSNLGDKYAMVYWDQRNAGASQGNRNGDKLSLNQMVEDLRKVILLIRYRYGQDISVFIAGHSFGGLLASAFVTHLDYQDLLKGWIVVDGTQNYALNDSLTKQMLITVGRQQIDSNKHREEWQEIIDYCTAHLNDLSFSESAKLERYASSAEDYILGHRENIGYKLLKEYAVQDQFPVTSIGVNFVYTWFSDFDKALINAEFSTVLYKVDIPTLLIWGAYDFITPKELGEDIYTRISTADKEMFVIPDKGHNFLLYDGKVFCERTNVFIQKFQ